MVIYLVIGVDRPINRTGSSEDDQTLSELDRHIKSSAVKLDPSHVYKLSPNTNNYDMENPTTGQKAYVP